MSQPGRGDRTLPRGRARLEATTFDKRIRTIVSRMIVSRTDHAARGKFVVQLRDDISGPNATVKDADRWIPAELTNASHGRDRARRSRS